VTTPLYVRTQSRPTNAYLAFGVSDYTSLSAEALEDLEGRLRIRIAALRRPTNAYLAFGVSDYTSLSAEALEDLEGRFRIRIAALVMEVSP